MSGDEGNDGAPPGALGAWRLATLAAMALLGLIVLVALILTSSEANRQRDRALALQTHSYEVMILARTLQGTIARAEASLGRYVISGDRDIGRLYADEWQQAGSELDRLDNRTLDNPRQRAPIATLRAAFKERGEELSLTALATQYKRNNQALGRYYQARQASALRRINDTLDTIIGRERALLEERAGAAMQSVAWSTSAARVLAVFGIALVLGGIALGWFIVQTLADRAKAQAEADAERERATELSQAVAAVTAELDDRDKRLRQIEKMQAIGQLTGGIAHDFNNMLAVVIGGLELARRALAERHPAARHIDSAWEGAERATALTRRLLAFSREERLQVETFTPAALIGGMRELIDRTLGDTISVVVRDQAAGARVRADRLQLENVLLNLAVNARDAMDGRGTITIATARVRVTAETSLSCPPGDYCVVTVADSGCGMDEATLQRVFEPFFTTKPVGRGTGLGLSQVFAFARAAGGDVAIASAPGAGTGVSIYLPLGEPEVAGADPVAVGEPIPVMVGALEIMVVEDDPRVLAATSEALIEIGHRVVPCADPAAAAAILTATPSVDLILSDVQMPGLTGPEMIAALPDRFAHIPVLFVTGFAGETSEERLGGRPVLRKPFTLAALERAVADAAGRDFALESIAAE